LRLLHAAARSEVNHAGGGAPPSPKSPKSREREEREEGRRRRGRTRFHIEESASEKLPLLRLKQLGVLNKAEHDRIGQKRE
jgi:hypothetical protein